MKWLLVVLVVAAAACKEVSGPSAPAGADFTLAPGERVTIEDTSTRVKFLRVEGDSRCPADALCIQGGDALVMIEVDSAGGSREQLDLHTGSMAPVQYRNLVISLVQLMPYPFSSQTIKPDDYRATLRVVRQ